MYAGLLPCCRTLLAQDTQNYSADDFEESAEFVDDEDDDHLEHQQHQRRQLQNDAVEGEDGAQIDDSEEEKTEEGERHLGLTAASYESDFDADDDDE